MSQYRHSTSYDDALSVGPRGMLINTGDVRFATGNAVFELAAVEASYTVNETTGDELAPPADPLPPLAESTYAYGF